ncbi:alpha/beta hydrolase [Mycobacterium sp. E342]|uniref:alpha/beta hydrolase n=1 Tax=Mycobacterium sp. E342 TaxID=1834147 RepID=UPI0008024BA8|nr:alpha/beta hydrolase [Mycobacterium sp. E342]OBH31542.1 alpha/beta hydrolase [Mycobacterium sp. E342]
MTAARLVLVHGGAHTGRCWRDTLIAIAALRPNIESVVVDLPGRRHVPGDLTTLTIEDCVSSVAEQISSRCDGTVVLVGHSLAGVVLAGVVDRLGGGRVRHVIFVACCVPRNGECVIDSLAFGFRQVVRRIVNRSPVIRSPPWLVRHVFANAATREQRAAVMVNIVPESAALVTQPSVVALPESVRRSWVLTRRDRALPPAKQRSFIGNLGGVDEVVEVDAGHEAMITHPAELAHVLVQLAFSSASTATEHLPADGESAT